MNAQQAREKSAKNLEAKNDASLKKVMEQVNKAVKNGQFYCYHYDFLSEFAKKELEQKGYWIENAPVGRDGYTYTIKW